MLALTAVSLSFVLSTVLALPHDQPRAVAKHLQLPFSRQKSTAATNAIRRRDITAPLYNQVYNYIVEVDFGTPGQSINLTIDTGSSDVWVYSPDVNCTTCTDQYYDYTKSSSAVVESSFPQFFENYGTPDSEITGFFAKDAVSIAGTAVNQVFGVALTAGSGDPPGGILGIGESANEAVSIEGYGEYSGYIDTLKSSGVIDTRSYSIFFNDPTPLDMAAGTVIFGGYDSTKYTGDLVALPIIDPAGNGEPAQLDVYEPSISVSLGDGEMAVPNSAYPYTVLLDTGTAVSYIPEDQFTALNSVIGATILEGDASGFYSLPCTFANQAGDISFTFSNSQGDSVAIQVPWSELVLTDPSLPSQDCYLGVQAIPTGAGEYIFGDTFLRSAYLLYNFDEKTISLAQASYDTSQSKIVSL